MLEVPFVVPIATMLEVPLVVPIVSGGSGAALRTLTCTVQ